MSTTSYIILSFIILLLLRAFVFLLQQTSWEMPGFKVIYNTIGRDIRTGIRFLRIHLYVLKCHSQNLCVGEIFRNVVKKNPNKTCLISEDSEWTFQQVEDYSNQVANLFVAAGYQKGDEVALFMENTPEYVCIWLGLSKIGVIPALINTNLRLHSLAHSINAIEAKAVIFNADLATAVQDVIPLLNQKDSAHYYCLTKTEVNFNSVVVKSLNILLQDVSKNPPDIKRHKIDFKDKIFYIYTSGTTGLPKAAIIRHRRVVWMGAATKYLMLLTDDDVLYNALPLYHSAGGVLFLSVILMFGGTMAIRKKFSASNFWKDAIKYNATVSPYIGEMCRYLLNQPKSPDETRHKIRLMSGNGLKPQLWREFQERFKIKHIVELYGATEGNANVVNVFGKVGAVGFISRVFSRIYPVNLIKVDPETGIPIRNKEGFCIRCKPGEPGEIVGKIIRNSPLNEFDGYANDKATRKKIVTDCFEKGDMVFLSGDILVMDEYGYLYFQDRTGDTFRWHGENVSTCEVETAIEKVLGSVTCVVYGVEVPGTEGKAGMAAIQSDSAVDIDVLYKELSATLPSYAVPRFIRLCKSIETTGTYKLKKIELQKEGYDIEKVSEPLFVLDIKRRSYVRLDNELYNQIINEKIRL